MTGKTIMKTISINDKVLERKVNRNIWAVNLANARTKEGAKEIAERVAQGLPEEIAAELETVIELIDTNGLKVWAQ